MLKTILVLVGIVVLTGCELFEPSKEMTNEEIIIETKKCKDAGLDYTTYTAGLGGVTAKIVCR